MLAIALAVRLLSWRHATPGDPSLSPFDGDCLYHRLRAEQIARDFPHVAWRDPELGGAGGIDIPWPPLFDEVIAAGALAFGGEHLERSVAHAAAWTPVVLGVATVVLMGCLAGLLLGPGVELGVAMVAALSTPHALYSLFGRSDQHVLELLLAVAILVAYVKGLGATGLARRSSTAAAMGALIALSFWNWLGSALNLLFLASFVAAWHLLVPRDEPRSRAPAGVLAAGAGLGAVILAGSVALLAPEGALGRTSVLGVTGLHVMLTAGTAVFGGLLWCARRLDRDPSLPRRIGQLLVAGFVPLGAAAISAEVRSGIWHGLLALLRGNRWYRTIGEFAPMLFGGHEPLWREVGNGLAWYGVVPLAALIGMGALRRAWREGTGRPEALLLASWAVVSCLLALARYRFALYAAAPLAILAWYGVRHAQCAWVPARCRRSVLNAATVIVLVSPVGALAKAYLLSPPTISPGPLLTWIRERAPSSAGQTVYARWSWGHHVRALARRPAVANPFGTEGGAEGFEESLRAFLTADEDALVRVLRSHDASYLLNEDPRGDVEYQDVLPSGPVLADVRHGWLTGSRIVETSAYSKLVAYRLYAHDGSAVDGSPALPSFRILRETAPADRAKSDRPAFTLFGVVPGARLTLSGARPGAKITGRIRVRTNTGREFTWETGVVADATGAAELRVPYATGDNGSSIAGPFEVSSGGEVRDVKIAEHAVTGGQLVPVQLRGLTGLEAARKQAAANVVEAARGDGGSAALTPAAIPR